MTDVIVIDNLKPVDIFASAETVEKLIGGIEAEARSIDLDVTTEEGRKNIASVAYKVARSKTALDEMGKKLNEDHQASINVVNIERRKFRERLDALKDEIREPLNEFENKEKDRVAAHKTAYEKIESLSNLDGGIASLEFIEERQLLLESTFNERDWEEFKVTAEAAYAVSKHKLDCLFGEQKKYQEDQAELATLRAEKEETDRKNREDEIARNAAQAATDAAEAKAKAEREETERKAAADIQAAEQAKTDAEAKEKQAQEDKAAAEQRAEDAATAERERIEAVQKEETEAAEKRKADKEHHATVNNAAVEALKTAGLTEEQSKLAVVAIAKNEVPNVSISY